MVMTVTIYCIVLFMNFLSVNTIHCNHKAPNGAYIISKPYPRGARPPTRGSFEPGELSANAICQNVDHSLLNTAQLDDFAYLDV